MSTLTAMDLLFRSVLYMAVGAVVALIVGILLEGLRAVFTGRPSRKAPRP